MAKKIDEKPTIVVEVETAPTAEKNDEEIYDKVVQNMVDHINKTLETKWFKDHPEIIEMAIKLFTPPPPKYSKQMTYAEKNLQTAAYKRSLQTHEPVETITLEQILAEVDRMEKDKQTKLSKKAVAKAA